MTLNELTAAVAARLQGLLGNVAVYDTEVPDTLPAQAYVVVAPETGWVTATRHAAVANRHHWPVNILCVGQSPVQARTTTELVRARLTGQRIGPEVSRLVEQVSGPLIRDDRTAADIRYSMTLRYLAHLERTPR